MPCSKWLAKYFTEHPGFPFVLVLFAACPSCLFSHGCSCRGDPVAQRQSAGAQRGEQLSQEPVNETSRKRETAPSPWDSPGSATHCRLHRLGFLLLWGCWCKPTDFRPGRRGPFQKQIFTAMSRNHTDDQPKDRGQAQPASCRGVLGQGPPGSLFQSTPLKAEKKC